jgi:hypothetical protein
LMGKERKLNILKEKESFYETNNKNERIS